MIKIEKEPDGLGNIKENCCFCYRPTEFWAVRVNVAVCEHCSTVRTDDELPTKRAWCDDIRRRFPSLVTTPFNGPLRVAVPREPKDLREAYESMRTALQECLTSDNAACMVRSGISGNSFKASRIERINKIATEALKAFD